MPPKPCTALMSTCTSAHRSTYDHRSVHGVHTCIDTVHCSMSTSASTCRRFTNTKSWKYPQKQEPRGPAAGERPKIHTQRATCSSPNKKCPSIVMFFVALLPPTPAPCVQMLGGTSHGICVTTHVSLPPKAVAQPTRRPRSKWGAPAEVSGEEQGAHAPQRGRRLSSVSWKKPRAKATSI